VKLGRFFNKFFEGKEFFDIFLVYTNKNCEAESLSERRQIMGYKLTITKNTIFMVLQAFGECRTFAPEIN
jgi:hypothetical protein